MRESAWQPLQTARWLQGNDSPRCYICGAPNNVDAEACQECSAPMALAHPATDHGQPPCMIAVVGASGVGKTVYLGFLMDMLSRQTDRMHALARGPFSINLQQTTLAAFAKCQFPNKTANEPDVWNWVYCQVHRDPQSPAIGVIMPDMAGEAVLEEIDHRNTYRVIRELLKKSGAAMILIDAIPLRDGNRDQDFFAMKILSYLSEIEANGNPGWADRPVALVFTKVDQVESCRDDPTAFAKAHASGVWQHCQQKFNNHRFFAASVVGACAWQESVTQGRRRVPLRVEPHGIIEPFQWLIEQATTVPQKKKRGLAAAKR